MKQLILLLVLPLSMFLNSGHTSTGFDSKEVNYLHMSPEEFFRASSSKQTINLYNPDDNLASIAIFHATNLLRKRRGLRALKPNYELHLAGLAHIEAMQRHGFFGHYNEYDRRNRTMRQRVENQGGRFYIIAENLARVHPFDIDTEHYRYRKVNGQYFYYGRNNQPLRAMTYGELGKSVVKDWYNSKGHRENLLDPELTYLGVAVEIGTDAYQSSKLPHVYAAQEFGTKYGEVGH